MKTNTANKPPASLDASLLARKGEAAPAVRATVHNNPSLAWGAPQQAQPQNRPHNIRRLSPKSFVPEKPFQLKRHANKSDGVALMFKIEDESYLRLKYQSQISGQSSHDLIRLALDFYLNAAGVPQGSSLVLKPA